jgi:RNA polymerase sigma-54 factor
MQLEARTTQRLEQRLLPQMLQSIEVLQLATADLAQLVARQLETNEVLEEQPPEDPAAISEQAVDAAAEAASAWEGPGVRPTSDDVDGRRGMLENQPARVDPVLATVRQQIAFRELPRALAHAVLDLAERLDERGLLATPLSDVAAETSVPIELLRLALGELQTMDPRGLGAGSAVEAMLLQAVGDPDFALIEQLLTQHVQALAKNHLPDVARALDLDLDELLLLIERMRALTPAPAAGLRETVEPAIVPDVVAWLADGQVQVALADDGVPQLSVNEHYECLLRDASTDRALREHLRSRVRAANDLIFAIAHRQSTLLRVARVVVGRQRDFLVHGRVALRPLRIADVAGELGMHASTVSRAVAGKYVETALGTFPLREFCASGSADGTGGAGHARTAIAQQVADLVQSEDRSKPWSDDALVAQLARRGIAVARRTVTKLRQELGIPSSYRRRLHGRDKA